MDYLIKAIDERRKARGTLCDRQVPGLICCLTLLLDELEDAVFLSLDRAGAFLQSCDLTLELVGVGLLNVRSACRRLTHRQLMVFFEGISLCRPVLLRGFERRLRRVERTLELFDLLGVPSLRGRFTLARVCERFFIGWVSQGAQGDELGVEPLALRLSSRRALALQPAAPRGLAAPLGLGPLHLAGSCAR